MRVLYAGSFNPFHNGHKYVYDLTVKMFGRDNVVVGIGVNPSKPTNNSEFLKWTMNPLNMNVKIYNTTTAEFCAKEGIELLVRGIRPNKSLEYEEDLYYWNKKLGNIDTIFIPTPPHLDHLSSSVIRELTYLGHNITKDNVNEYINPLVYYRWLQKEIPTKAIVFGKTCVGKSYYINNILNASGIIINCDTEIKKYLDIKYTHDPAKEMISIIMSELKNSFNRQNISKFHRYIRQLSCYINWKEFLSSGTIYDFAALGSYIKYIPIDIISQFKLIEVNSDDATRMKNCLSKKWSKNKIKKLDNIYISPSYRDIEVSSNY